MKKFLPVLVILLALGAAGATVFLYQRPGAGGTGTSASAGYLSADTLVYLSIPDPKQTADDWKTTDLYKLWSEPSVQAFFAKPLSKIPADWDFNETLAQINKVAPYHAFAALTALDEKSNEPHLIAGFQFKGTTADVDQLLGKAKDALRKSTPAGRADLVKYQDHSLETFTDGGGKVVASAYLNDWYFISNDLALLKATLDRADHRTPADHPALDADADFKTVLAKMPSGPATVAFARPRVLFDRIFALAAASGQTMNEEQLAEMRKIKAIGATTAIDNGKLRDTLYCLAPGYKVFGGPLQMSALPLTSLDTLLFYAGLLQTPEKGALPPKPAGSGPNAMSYDLLAQYASKLKEQGISLENFSAAFGREVSIQLDWLKGANQPSLVMSLDVRDPAASGKFVDAVLKAIPVEYAKVTTPNSTATVGTLKLDSEGAMYRSLTIPNVTFVSPTLALTDKHFLLGLSFDGVHDAVTREKTHGANFTSSEAYKTAASTVGKPNFATTYIDTKPLFERTYALVKPFALFGAAVAGPQVNDYADLSKLPDGEAISKHLSPIILSEKADDQGILLESVGPVTFMQATAGFGAIVGAAAVPILQKQMGAMTGQTPGAAGAGTPDGDDAPETTPAPSSQPPPGQ